MPTVVITGGTGGIGAGVAAVMAARGWNVIATGATEAEVAGFAAPEGVAAVSST